MSVQPASNSRRALLMMFCAFKTMRAIRDAHPGARVVCVTSHDQPDYRRAAFDAGASGYVAKENLSDLYLLVATKRLLTRPRS